MSSSMSSPVTTVRPRKWDVIHACDNARQVADLLDAQACANIRAYIVSRPRPQTESLLQSWNEVRKWSSLLNDHLGEPPFDSAGLLVHAHSFAAGMAGIRSDQPCVYDLNGFVEQISAEASRPWLGRSFRAAEQFVLSQASAIVVHDAALYESCLARGVTRDRVFRVPHSAPVMPDTSASRGLRTRLGISDNDIAIFSEIMDAPLAAAILNERNAGRSLRLLLTEPASVQMAFLPQADQLGQVAVSLSHDHHETAIAASDIVIAISEDPLVISMTHGKPSISVDTEQARSVSPDGAGIVWCSPADPADRARRFSYLIRDREMRDSLGTSARRFITSARSLERIGKMYEEVYRFATEHKGKSKSAPPNGTLVPVSANF